jgi:hypothetical protein
VKFPRSISGFRPFGFSRFMEHSLYHDESRGIEGGQRPKITKARKSAYVAIDRGHATATLRFSYRTRRRSKRWRRVQEVQYCRELGAAIAVEQDVE